jgi:putative spermidine/putrescine transport system permease protein
MTTAADNSARPQRDWTAMLTVPAVAYLAVIYLMPLVWLLTKSVSGPDGFSIEPFMHFFSDPYSWRVMTNTVTIAVGVTLVCGIVQAALLVAIILPLSIGVVVKAFAWQIVLRRDGIVSQILVGLGIWSEPQRLLFTETGLILGAANVFLPFMILPIYSVLKLIDPHLREAGATLGASPLYTFRHIVLPLTLPGAVSGIAFVFSMSVSMFVIPSLLIGDRFQTLSTLTGRSFLLMRDERLGSTTAVVLLAIAVAIVLASTWISRRLGGRS